MLHHGLVSKALVACAAFAMILLIAPKAMAVTFVVNSNLDQPDDLTMPGTCHTAAGTCTLRAAVMQANLIYLGATITLPADTYKLTIPASGGDGAEVGDLNICQGLIGISRITIAGAGASTTIIDANQLDRAFSVSFGCIMTISGVTIKNGLSAAPGGGILNDGTLTLDGVVVHDNHTAAPASSGGGVYSSSTLTVRHSTFDLNSGFGGGGISSTGSLTVSDSAFSQNTASQGGGGAIATIGTATLTNSTINNNESGDTGGGIISLNSLTIVNSTISQNNAVGDGGGIYMQNGEANIYSSTISFNGADSDANGFGLGGGIYNYDDGAATTHLRNDLIAGNYISHSPTYRDCSGTIDTFGKNLFWDTTGCTLPQPAATWDLLGSLASLDSALKNNGGPTKTHALLAGSNAIDGGDPTLGCIGPDSNPLPTDQRGFTRVGGVRCDIGAFELSDTIFADRFE